MPQIETPDNFDFKYDQHKLLLIEDLKRLSRSIETLQTIVDESSGSDEEVAAPPQPSVLVPAFGRQGTGIGPTLEGGIVFTSADGAGLAGYAYFEAFAGAWASNSVGLQYYTRPGTTTPAQNAYMQANHGTAGPRMRWYAHGKVPQNISGWESNAIELDWRASWPTLAAQTINVVTQIWIGNVAVLTQTEGFTAGGAGTYDTGWRTIQLTSDDIPPNTLRENAGIYIYQTCIPSQAGTGTFYVGELRLNWR